MRGMVDRPPTLHDFIDDELLRAPMTLDRVIDAVQEQWRALRPGHGAWRTVHDPTRTLRTHRGELVSAALRALREAVQADIRPGGMRPTSFDDFQASLPMSLALIDDDTVVADIEIARCIETIKLAAEDELRELQTYTATLVNDPNVSRDTNPFRPEIFVRALWQGVQTGLPLDLHGQAAFMHEATPALASALRQAYAGAADRLEERGVTAARHRTIVTVGHAAFRLTGVPLHVPPPPARHDPTARPEDRSTPAGAADWPPRPGLQYASQAPMPPARPAAPTAPTHPPASAGRSGVLPDGAGALSATIWPSRRPANDTELRTLLRQLFDELAADRAHPAEFTAFVHGLLPVAERLQGPHEDVLHRDHALWHFIDLAAHAVQLCAVAERPRVLGLLRNLQQHLTSLSEVDAERLRWATSRLQALQTHLLQQAQSRAQPTLERHRAAAARLPDAPETRPLDLGSMDTVPADLLDAPPPTDPGEAAADLGALWLRPGEHLHIWLQGHWRMLQLVLVDERLPLWVLRDLGDDQAWPVRPSAIERLTSGGLARPVALRSLVRRAVDRLRLRA
ncbi:MAG: hypothetical protein RIQ53_4119 [Pseudomonadota bacterium]